MNNLILSLSNLFSHKIYQIELKTLIISFSQTWYQYRQILDENQYLVLAKFRQIVGFFDVSPSVISWIVGRGFGAFFGRTSSQFRLLYFFWEWWFDGHKHEKWSSLEPYMPLQYLRLVVGTKKRQNFDKCWQIYPNCL